MAYGDLFRSDLARGVAIGAGLILLVPLAVVTLAPVARPAMRGALKAGMLAYEKGRETLAEFAETFDDVSAEVQAELRQARMAEATAGEAAPAGDEPHAAEPDK
jgi:hypothetical protein